MTVSKVVKGAEKVRDPGPLSLRERARVGPSPPAHLPKGEGRVRDLVIVVNPGSTSTKLAVYRGPKCVAEQAINHPKDELAKFERVTDQYEFRLEAVMAFLAISGIELDRCLAVAGRGGLTKPLLGGVYGVNARMIRDLRSGKWGEHPSSLGAPLAQEIGRRAGATGVHCRPGGGGRVLAAGALFGSPGLRRKSRFHALSQRAAARRAARQLDISYEKANFIVVHMGGGISIGAHRKGRVVDVNDALDGDGPFSPERSGSVPTGPLVAACFSGEKHRMRFGKCWSGGGNICTPGD